MKIGKKEREKDYHFKRFFSASYMFVKTMKRCRTKGKSVTREGSNEQAVQI